MLKFYVYVFSQKFTICFVSCLTIFQQLFIYVVAGHAAFFILLAVCVSEPAEWKKSSVIDILCEKYEKVRVVKLICKSSKGDTKQKSRWHLESRYCIGISSLSPSLKY